MKRRSPYIILSLLVLLSLAISLSQPAAARNHSEASKGNRVAPSVGLRPTVVAPTRYDLSQPLTVMHPQAVPSGGGSILRQIPKAKGSEKASQRDESIIQHWHGPDDMPAPLQSFEGVENLFGGWPPDTNGDIGLNHYMQWINLHLEIWEIDKENNTATPVFGPVQGNVLFDGFGGICDSNNDGDPIALYDPLADRWFASQFALDFGSNRFYQCIAVSQTGDPTGAWYRYQYEWPNNLLNDYPKFGVWPDAYYMTVNQFEPPGFGWAGAGVAAFDRAAMLNGDPATMVYFDLFSVEDWFGGMLPADFDGTELPPDGTPGLFAEWDDSAWTPTEDAMRIWEFHVDWADPPSSTFGVNGQPNYTVVTGDVDYDMCGGSRACIPQPDTSAKLDAIADRLMNRLQYRNLGDVEVLMANHTVDENGANHAGIHWMELRHASGDWSMYQEGVYAPDSDHRWMGSVAMDHVGNIALGFSASSSSLYPSVRYAGRLADDPLGTLPQGEESIIEGTGSQTDFTYSRWGDYSMLAVDPSDDCTFWYTQEYVPVTGSNTWSTRIGSFRLPDCSIEATGTLEGTVTDSASSDPIAGANIQAAHSDGRVFNVTTDDAGMYSKKLVIGDYELTASAFGYLPSTVSGLSILTDTLTIQDFSLDLAPTHTVSGTVSDADTGWPLAAEISFPGTPVAAVFSDPDTGFYSVNLPAGLTYTLDATPLVAGYLPGSTTVGPLDGDTTANIELAIDVYACSAPNYIPTYSYLEDFESGLGNWSPTGLWNEESQDDVCGALVAPFPSPTQAVYYGKDDTCTYDTGGTTQGSLTMKNPISVPASGVAKFSAFSYEQTECNGNCSSDNRRFEISDNGGSSWTLLGEGDTEGSWYERTFDLAPYQGQDVLFRFRFSSMDNSDNDFFGWMVDNVGVITGCTPLEFGVDLAPTTAQKDGAIGKDVTYQLSVTNTGNAADTFLLSVEDNQWPTTFSQDSITLDPGKSANFTVTVSVPDAATPGDMDVAHVAATSDNDPGKSEIAELTTTAVEAGSQVFLPIIHK